MNAMTAASTRTAALAVLGVETALFVAHWPLFRQDGAWASMAMGVIAVIGLLAIPAGYTLRYGRSLLGLLAALLAIPLGAVVAQLFFPGTLVAATDTPWWASAIFMSWYYGPVAAVATFVGLAVRQARAMRRQRS